MKQHHRVTGIIKAASDFIPDRSLLAMKKGEILHSYLADQWRGEGHYVEVPHIGILFNKDGAPITSLSGSPDLYWFEPSKKGGFTLFIIDHKTVSLKDKLYMKSEWWNQLALYALVILAYYRDSQPEFIISDVVVGVWFYQRHNTIKESLKVVKKTTLPSVSAQDIINKGNKYLSTYFKEEICLYGLGRIAIKNEM